ncbi:sodium:solute symporter [Neptunicella sp. SCSIO 80796]|uniref:sodium:solute symporter n=1 Tax=Neptunicella plasticusilytica TaxID=3117012 RepID=UPI003A4D7023
MNQVIPGIPTAKRQPFSFIYTGLIALLVLVMMSMGAEAESLVSVKTDRVKGLPSDVAISAIWPYQEQLVALGQDNLWVFDQVANSWQKNDFVLQGAVSSVVYNKDNTYLLMADNADGFINKVASFTLTDQSLARDIPTLPQPLQSAAGAVLDEHLFIVGTSIKGIPLMYGLDLSVHDLSWETYPVWQQQGDEIVTSVVAQTDRLQVTLGSSTGKREFMQQWDVKNGWNRRGEVPGAIVEGTGRPIGQGHVLYLTVSPDHTKTKMMSFHTITGSWAELEHWDNHTVLFGTGWKEGILWVEPSNNLGESHLAFTQIQSRQHFLTLVDWIVLVVYLALMLGIGLYFYMQHAQSSEANFFLGGRSIPFWAAGISLYASNASSISYIAVPAKAFATNWQYLMSNLIVVFGLMFVAVWIAPLLRRLNLISVFHYLETRFHPSIRLLSSILFVVFQLGGRMTVILYLPSLALSTVTGIDITMCILVMGFVTICYTVLGGMKAVIWTDVLQLFVMFGGTIFAIVFILMKLDGGTAEFISSAMADNKFKLIDLSFNLTDATVWGFLFLVFFDTVLTFPKDQVLMQRVFSTSSDKHAGRSMWTFSAIVIPGSAMFFLIGTALYVFYQVHPERMDPSLSLDATFPLFISAELPVGITGLIIAGIFAAAMSTLSSILNSVATVSTVDFYEKRFKNKLEKQNVRFAELVTVVAGLIGIGLALLLASYNANSLLDVALELWGLLGGGFAGAYTLGMFTRRANWQGVVIGVTVSFIVTFLSWSIDLVHPYFYMPLSVFVCIVVGYAASWLFPAVEHLDGLTIYSDKAKSEKHLIKS